ncbi:bifunctional uridylyltransferase/uridylyl-removing protein GlnD [Vibrio gallicus]|uniref:bifunctional uridylyltransferase/uridylyl-removing protein GlnD n=1 Tax=Vibrio gallicus TaxID=190897 RepID=UPI0036F2AFB7
MDLLSIQQLSDNEISIAGLKQRLADFSEQQKQQFLAGYSVIDLVAERSLYMDALLARLWQHYHFDSIEGISLVAVGGYGRQELHPLSDIDILILSKRPLKKEWIPKVSEFVTLLWDLRLEVGHSVRTLKECYSVAKEDLTVATNLLESRLICGSQDCYAQLNQLLNKKDFWPSEVFYKAKLEEQKERHARYHDTGYNLEPDIKSSPGGLRDIHTLSWVARCHFGATCLIEMSQHGFLTDAEYRELQECQNFLWQIRFALHIELKRYDNRLSFAYQAKVAENLGFTGERNQPVERMMKEFYRTLRRITELNKMLLKLFDQAIINKGKLTPAEILDDDFQRRGHLIEARKPALFQARPETILDMFIHITNDASITGVSPPTLRQLRTARRRLNKFLHDIPVAREKFLQLVRHPNVLSNAFRLMHQHGVLAAYLPQWSQIVGQMQFDLFHVYTVDEHTIRLLKHIHSFSFAKNHERNPICCEVLPRIQKPELLIIAAIFHDIGKGRGGDHSEIGEGEALQFCTELGLSKAEAKLVAWLVKNHLMMSVTAQKRDIQDPEVITEFAKKVRNEEYLEFLVCLTVADICATNPEFWNSWKRSLLSELFYSTQRALRRGLEHPADARERIRHNQQQASLILQARGFDKKEVDLLWQRFKADYFLRHTHQQLVWHTEGILQKHQQGETLILASPTTTRGGTEVFVYTKDQPVLFASIVAELDRRNYNIHDAQVMVSRDGYVLDTFIISDQNNKPLGIDCHERLANQLRLIINDGRLTKIKTRRTPRNLVHFKVKTITEFVETKNNKHTMMELVALDTPGLLASVGATFAEFGIHLHAAKITTIGERAEDLFIITSPEYLPLNDDLKQQLCNKLEINLTKLAPN